MADILAANVLKANDELQEIGLSNRDDLVVDSPCDAPPSRAPPISPILPWEVIETIIDQCPKDTITLCNLALTCRQLKPRSIHVLFSHVVLRSRRAHFSLCDVLRARPHLQSLVLSVNIGLMNFAPFPLLSMLPQLHHIAFDDLVGNGSLLNMFGSTVNASTLMCCHRFGGGIRSLTIDQLQPSTYTAFLNVLLAFTGIEDLTCRDIKIRRACIDAGAPVNRLHRLLSAQMRLRTLRVSNAMVFYIFICTVIQDSMATIHRLALG